MGRMLKVAMAELLPVCWRRVSRLVSWAIVEGSCDAGGCVGAEARAVEGLGAGADGVPAEADAWGAGDSGELVVLGRAAEGVEEAMFDVALKLEGVEVVGALDDLIAGEIEEAAAFVFVVEAGEKGDAVGEGVVGLVVELVAVGDGVEGGEMELGLAGGGVAVGSAQGDGVAVVDGFGDTVDDATPMVLGGGSTTTLGSSNAPGGTIALGGQSIELRGGLLANFGTISGGPSTSTSADWRRGRARFRYRRAPSGRGVYAGRHPRQCSGARSHRECRGLPLDPNQSTAASVLLNANTLATVNTADGTLTFTRLVGPGKTLTKVGGGTLALAAVRAGGLAVNDGTVKILTNGGNSGTSTLNGLSIASAGRLDLTNNKLIVSGGDIGGIAGLVKSGYHVGAWDGPGS